MLDLTIGDGHFLQCVKLVSDTIHLRCLVSLWVLLSHIFQVI